MSDVYEINVAKTEFREAYNTGDVNRLLSVFAEGFIDMSDGGPSQFGEESRTNLAARVRGLFTSYSVKLNVIIIDIVILGDKAYDFGWHEFTLAPKNGGETLRKRHRYMELWQKSDGGWKISFVMDNADVPEEFGGLKTQWFASERRSSTQTGQQL